MDNSKKQSPYRQMVKEQLADMLGAFPQAAPPHVETYVRTLFEEVLAAEPSEDLLKRACRRVVLNKVFVPSVSEMLRAIREEQIN